MKLRVRSPIRASVKGGGLEIYINKNVWDEDDYDEIGLDVHQSDKNGGFLFVKIIIYKKTEKTDVLGNIYHSPTNYT